jgi:hypothetical protein
MAIKYRDLLPSVIKNTRWGQFADAYQYVIDLFTAEKINPIKDQYNIDKMSNDEIKNIAFLFGYNLYSLTGYTSSTYYLKKQIETISKRISYKNTKKGYQTLGYIYDLFINVYPIRLIGLDSIFSVRDTYWEDEAFTLETFSLDMDPGVTLDSDDWPSLDVTTSSLNKTIRHFVIQYSPKYIEDATTFISKETLFSFGKDVDQQRRTTEIPYFEHMLKINTSITGAQTDKTWVSYDNGVSFIQESKAYSPNLLNIIEVQLGDSILPDLSSTPSGVQNLSYTYSVSGALVNINSSATRFNYRIDIEEKCKNLVEFSEIALLNSSGVAFYSHFPTIKNNDSLNSNLAFDIRFV